MRDDLLPPETFLALQIQLDRLHRSAEQCRCGLRGLRGGKMSREAYRDLLDRQLTVQREWESKNRALFSTGD
jgi:hypothetical protein